jgi:glucan phosphoethanolaminetransferase (alkaline phosphatase superfamily)
VLSLWLSLGFWCLLFAGARWLYLRSRVSLLATAPLFLLAAVLCAIQQIHHQLFGAFIDGDRLFLIRLNWDTIVDGVMRAGTPAPLVLAGVLGAALPFVVYVVGSRRPAFVPLRGAGGVRAVAALSWLCWSATEFGFHALERVSTPDLAGHVLANEIGDVLRKDARAATERARTRWAIARTGTAPVSAPDVANGKAAAAPNLVLILLESVRADHLPSYGHHRNTMPFVAELAAAPETFRFEYAYANSSASYFSMLSLLTGIALSRDADTFARAPLIWDHLAVRGYESFVVTQSVGYPRYLLDDFMQTPGLASYLDVGQSRVADFRAAAALEGRAGGLRRDVVGHLFEHVSVERDDAWSLEAFQQRILARDPARPFFGVWEIECTHYPYCYPDAFRRYEPAKAYFRAGDVIGALRNDYDNALLYADHVIQQLMRFLAAQQLAQDTVVAISSDHGESFLERGALFHGGVPYVEQMRVPLLLIVPPPVRARLAPEVLDALAANRAAPVQLLDLLPTLLDLADGARGSGDLPGDGDSLLRPLAPDRELWLSNDPPLREARPQKREEARVSRQHGYVIVYGDGRPSERYALDGRPLAPQP